MKELTGMVGRVVGQKRYFIGFERSSQLTAVNQERCSETEESLEVNIPENPVETVDVYKEL